MKKAIITSILAVFVFTILCGVLYTGAITGISQLAFNKQANGSIIEVNGEKYGCELLGQKFSDEKHMWGRIMNIDITTFVDENGKALMYSVPSNLSPASEEYKEIVAKRVVMIKEAHKEKENMPIPVDLVTCSGSGLDPQISVAAANYQLERISKNNNISKEELNKIVDKCTNQKFLGIFGEKTINVLKVNLMIDGILK